jgi:hypothetical protein
VALLHVIVASRLIKIQNDNQCAILVSRWRNADCGWLDARTAIFRSTEDELTAMQSLGAAGR